MVFVAGLTALSSIGSREEVFPHMIPPHLQTANARQGRLGCPAWDLPRVIRQSALNDYADWIMCEVLERGACTSCPKHIQHQRLFMLCKGWVLGPDAAAPPHLALPSARALSAFG